MSQAPENAGGTPPPVANRSHLRRVHRGAVVALAVAGAYILGLVGVGCWNLARNMDAYTAMPHWLIAPTSVPAVFAGFAVAFAANIVRERSALRLQQTSGTPTAGSGLN